MRTHICQQCGKTYDYCRACLISPILYKELGFCSEQCRDKSKNKIEEVIPTEDVEVVITDGDTPTSE